jgi:hypothetical protein
VSFSTSPRRSTRDHICPPRNVSDETDLGSTGFDSVGIE